MEKSPKKILVIEDNQGDLFIITEYLKRTSFLKYDLLSTSTLQQAAEMMRLSSFAVILVDLYLPDSHGISTFTEVYGLAGNAPVIVLSGLVNENITREALKSGAQDYLVKGDYDEKLLEKTIMYAIERKHNQVMMEEAATRYQKELEQQVESRTRELREAIEKERELTELKSRFISIASHEFRTPLSSISLAAETIRTYFNKLSQDEISKKLSKIEEQAEHMTRLLEDVLTIGKAEVGKINVKQTEINLRNFIRGILDEVRESVKNQRAIGLNYATKLEKLHVDDKLLRNIIINLLTNALKFSAAHTIVAFSIYDHSNYVVFEVKDEGIGIAENDLKNIFEPFQRASNSVDIPGTGLGLSIAKRAVDLMEGSIEVESKVNEGSLFRVMIPVK